MGDFLINLSACVAFFIIGFSFNKISSWIRNHKHRKMWQSFFNEKEVTVVLTTHDGPYVRSSPRISFYEMEAYVKLQKVFASLKIKLKPVSSEANIRETSTKSMIILGGPKSNKLCSIIYNKIQNNLHYKIDIVSQSIKSLNNEYIPEFDSEGRITIDYGIIIKTVNPFNSEKNVLLAMGCHGLSTYGLMENILNKKKLKIFLEKIQEDYYVALVKFTYREGIIFSNDLVNYYKPLL